MYAMASDAGIDLRPEVPTCLTVEGVRDPHR